MKYDEQELTTTAMILGMMVGKPIEYFIRTGDKIGTIISILSLVANVVFLASLLFAGDQQ